MSTRKWQYRFDKAASKQLTKLSPKERVRVSLSIEELAQADNPAFVPGVKHIQGSNPKQWRQRQGNYRIIFELEPGAFVETDIEYNGWIPSRISASITPATKAGIYSPALDAESQGF